jgi:cobalt-zinc-cadmium efflux system membrane fusion protein
VTADGLVRTSLGGGLRRLSRRACRALALAGALAAFVAPPVGAASAAENPPAKAEPATFKPSSAQWASLQFAKVEQREFRSERLTEGSIAVDDDLTTPVFSPYSGRVVRLMATWGDTVQRGAALFAVEASEYVQAVNDLVAAVAALKTATAAQAQARVNEKRAHDLYLSNGGALKDWQQSQTDLGAAQNAATAAEIALSAVRDRLRILGRSDTEIAAIEGQPARRIDPVVTVSAPISGTVTQRQVGVGQYINSAANGASNPVYTIGDLSTVWLVANVREADAGLVHPGTEAEVRVPAYPDRVFQARLSWVAAALDPNTHRLSVRADVANPDGALKPGMFASFTLIVGTASAAPAVPATAIVYEADTARVWITPSPGVLMSRAVRTGRSSNGMVEILDGLAPSDTVVTKGTLFIDRAAAGD